MKTRLPLVLSLTIWLAFGADLTQQTLEDEMKALKEGFNQLKKTVSDLSRQTMLQQFSIQERSRANYDSGVKAVRSRHKGHKNYESPSHVGKAVYSIHDHSNYLRTIGMGELSVMMNGVTFRTRHNDYKLSMPSTTSRNFKATENIPIPEVPPTVKGTLEEQIDEMREWFKAFKNQDHSVRDYRKYFKPVLCYIEGTWTLDKELQEPFSSDRHQIDASSWFDLQEKVMFTSYTGSKSNAENLAYLPTAILSVNTTTGVANYAQWNYRILCKPLKTDVPLAALQYEDDLAYRMKDGKTVDQTLESRAARFKIFDDKKSDRYQLLDELFYEIPGMDNLPSDNMTEATLDNNELLDVAYGDKHVPLKTGYYHRQYKFIKAGANGLMVNPRGFNDENMWVAQTTQKRVAPVNLKVCQGKGSIRQCQTVPSRMSYAIPLELIFMTPLLSWNPYNITINQQQSLTKAGGADGKSKPYHGVDRVHYYITPYQFFLRSNGNYDPADTTRGTLNVYDSNGNVRKVVASGTRILTKEIPDVGMVRLRYPVAPVSGEGGAVWKEVNALKDLVNAIKKDLRNTITPGGDADTDDVEPDEVFFKMAVTVDDPPGEHSHDISIPYKLFKERLIEGKYVWVESEQKQGHTHTIQMKYNRRLKRYDYYRCGLDEICWDGHPTEIELITKNKYTLR